MGEIEFAISFTIIEVLKARLLGTVQKGIHTYTLGYLKMKSLHELDCLSKFSEILFSFEVSSQQILFY